MDVYPIHLRKKRGTGNEQSELLTRISFIQETIQRARNQVEELQKHQKYMKQKYGLPKEFNK